jgi:dTDP-4-amino-4,6-dideoxygalactose transaminase
LNVEVPPFRIEFEPGEVDAFLREARAVLESGRLTLGSRAERLEREFAAIASTRHCVVVNSGSTALEVIYRVTGVSGRTVLVPTNTNFATAAAALYAGGRVELYDAGLYPDLGDIRRRLREEVRALVVVHIGGYITPELDEIRALCQEAGVALIEDAAHAHGATIGGRAAGGLGTAAAFSFFPTKVMTTGEGGAITTDDGALAEAAREYRDQGKRPGDQLHAVMGNSWRMDELSAALGLVQVPAFHRALERRRAVIDRYQAELDGCPGITWPDTPGMRPSGYKCVVEAASAARGRQLQEQLRERGVSVARGVYEVPLHQQPVFQALAAGAYPVAERFAATHVCLPLWTGMQEAQVDRVIEAVGQAARGRPSNEDVAEAS